MPWFCGGSGRAFCYNFLLFSYSHFAVSKPPLEHVFSNRIEFSDSNQAYGLGVYFYVHVIFSLLWLLCSGG